MRRILVAALAVAAGLAWGQSASAQGMMRGMGPMAGLGILRSDEAKAELKLTDEQSDKIGSMLEEMRASMMERFQSLQDVPEGERQEKAQSMMRELGADVKKQLQGVLDKDQYARYEQISLQAMGVEAFNQEEVVTGLKLTDEQKTKLGEITSSMREETMSIFQGSQGDREGAMKKLTELRETTMKKVQELLTAEQKADWEKLIGKPFKMPAFGGPGGPGGRRGPG